jgi:NAD(P)-dependent dehydrogenase (short-subunit alcohol dehydrogenase family)
MNGRLLNKVALVTGGSSGIGRAAAIAIAREGARVVIGSRRIEESLETVRLIDEAGGEAMFCQTDVSQATQVEALIDSALSRYDRLDCAFNNAGTQSVMANTAECTEADWDRTIATNLKGVWLSMKYEIRVMLKQGGGVIVNNASIAGVIGTPMLPAYSASKGGIVQLTRTAALEFARSNIRINVVCPGGVLTAMGDR